MDNDKALTIVAELRVTTEASIWLERPDIYMRLPRIEGPRVQIEDLDGAARDAEWHEYEGVLVLDIRCCGGTDGDGDLRALPLEAEYRHRFLKQLVAGLQQRVRLDPSDYLVRLASAGAVRMVESLPWTRWPLLPIGQKAGLMSGSAHVGEPPPGR
jgi:hypothetical protein